MSSREANKKSKKLFRSVRKAEKLMFIHSAKSCFLHGGLYLAEELLQEEFVYVMLQQQLHKSRQCTKNVNPNNMKQTQKLSMCIFFTWFGKYFKQINQTKLNNRRMTTIRFNGTKCIHFTLVKDELVLTQQTSISLSRAV